MLDWAMTSPSAPPSPPAMAGFSQTPTDSLNTEMVPDAAQKFYAFLEGQYDPRLFVPDPVGYFLKDHPSLFISSKKRRVRRVSRKKASLSYCLRPRRLDGRAITSYSLR
ncbi:hypothetical protein O181_121228 [Austropuccinia psidii MF-1]|uniref:Uncharacterized protein n=1 Tax=Austropuccinia psidii MF-1 TaxID=1389203 RepID=A0A9Q3KHI8_9BASI|nr:hypothetical protein [Austropuccinia psidii MF-1]